MKKHFLHMKAFVLFSLFGLIILLVVGSAVSVPAATSYRTVVVQHNIESIPSSVTHVRYAFIDENGSRSDMTSPFPVSESRTLEGVPSNAVYIVAVFHTVDNKVIHEDVMPLSSIRSINVKAEEDSCRVNPNYDPMEFKGGRFAIVDIDKDTITNTGNILVRGNLPWLKKNNSRTDRYFAYEEIKTKMTERMKKIDPGLGDSFTFNIDNYEIVEFALHGGCQTGNYDDVIIEMKALGLGIDDIPCKAPINPAGCTIEGKPDYKWNPKEIFKSIKEEKKPWGLVWWPIPACTHTPCDDGAGLSTTIALKDYKFLETSVYLKELLTTRSASGKPRLIYFHCVTGCDRTGALHITYILDNTDYTFKQASEMAIMGAMIKKGHDGKNVNVKQLEEELIPMCNYASLAYRYCQEKNKNNQQRLKLQCGDEYDLNAELAARRCKR
jgi:hypothetical protein